MKPSVLISAALAAAALATSALAAPRGPNSPAPLASFVPPPFALGVAHKVVDTVLSSGDALLTVPAATYTRIDTPIKIKCPSSNGCTVVLNSTVQVASSATGNWAICPIIDGYTFNNSCGYLGAMGAVDGYVQKSTAGYYQVTQGSHTVQTNVYMDAGGSAYFYSTVYTVTTP